MITDLDRLPFDARVTAKLPADPTTTNTLRQVQHAAFSRVVPTPTSAPRTLAWSAEVASLLGLDQSVCDTPDFAAVFSGNRVPRGADPFALCYGGHQFGNWAGQLGDGRAIALGEVIDANGSHQTLQLKGAGPTPYSRRADGRAVLRSSVREFLCSEAMFHLGVPTTRALSLTATGDAVMRDMLYDGNPGEEPGAVVCRVAPSFTRFGSFELPASRGDVELLRQLVEFTIRTDFPAIWADPTLVTLEDRLVAWFSEVVERTAALAVHWMRVGFVHGVLNTDNMSILGLTIDFGPYGWLEGFDPDWTPNTTDSGQRRYRFGMQPQVMHWNLAQLANALVPVLETTERLQGALDRYPVLYGDGYASMMAERFGWGMPQPGDDVLLREFYDVLRQTETDYVLFCRNLARVPVGEATDEALIAPLLEAYYRPEELVGSALDQTVAWLRRWGARVIDGGLSVDKRIAVMDARNPKYVLRNWMAQLAIDAAAGGDLGPLHELHELLRNPYDEQPERSQYAVRRPEWARVRVGCSMLSCSS